MQTTRRWSVCLLLAALCCLISLLETANGQSQPPGRNGSAKEWAVIIGISHYSQVPGGQQLQFADRDASAFAEALEKTGVRKENIKLLLGQEATISAIKAAIGNWLAKSVSTDDRVYIFFSGHGIFEREFGESYLLAFDSDPADPYTSAFSINDLTDALNRRIRAGNVLVIADAVRGDFFPPEEEGNRDSSSFVLTFNQMVASRAGLNVILASGQGEYSREGKRWGDMGVFTRSLVDAFNEANPDVNNTRTAEGIFHTVSARVAKETSNKQHPWHGGFGLASMLIRTNGSLALDSGQKPPAPTAEKTPEPVALSVKRAEQIAPANNAPANNATENNRQAATDYHEPAGIEPRPEEAIKDQPSARVPTPPAKSPAKPDIVANNPKPEAVSGGVSTPVTRSNSTGTRKSGPSNPSPNGASKSVRGAGTPPANEPIRSAGVPAATSSDSPNVGEPPRSAPPPRRPTPTPPETSTIEASSAGNGNIPIGSPNSAPAMGTAPSPLVLQFQAAIADGRLLEPKNASAWDIYQRLADDPATRPRALQLKPRLAEALTDSGRAIVSGDVRSDNVSDKVDEFKRAGQMFSRARALMPELSDVAALEKVSAAQALIALQFYDEAERALAQLQGTRLATIENSMGLIYSGRLDSFQAERAFKRAIELDPKWAAPHYNLALLYRNQRDDDALAELEQAASLGAGNIAILTALGDGYFNLQQWQKAADVYRKAVDIEPSNDTLHTKLGHALYSQGLRDEANQEYQKATRLRSKQP